MNLKRACVVAVLASILYIVGVLAVYAALQKVSPTGETARIRVDGWLEVVDLIYNDPNLDEACKDQVLKTVINSEALENYFVKVST